MRYVLEESVQRSADRLRVGVQLIDSRTNRYLWVDRLDRDRADLFALRDEITAISAGEPRQLPRQSKGLLAFDIQTHRSKPIYLLMEPFLPRYLRDINALANRAKPPSYGHDRGV